MSSSGLDGISARMAYLVSRWELPGRRYWFERAGVLDNARWTTRGHAECRGRWHGYRLRLNLADYHQRGAYFLGRLFDLPVQVALLRAMRPGDEYLDVGANIGMTVLIGAYAVGARGMVTAIEPNPSVCAELRAHVESNGLSWVRIIEAGFSDREQTLTLSVPPTGNTGAGTFGVLPPRHKGKVSATYDVPVVVGDNHINPEGAPLTIKIDVEGFETAAFRGLARAITTRKPAIVAEVNPQMLSASGSSAAEFIGMLRGWGYEIFIPGAAARAMRRRERFWLEQVGREWVPEKRLVNIVAAVPGTVHWKRLESSVVENASNCGRMSDQPVDC
ncbi:MAG: FkbM family methyltransferase [Phycisphaeraceae bacterium]|nr:FkbM family methyltransferase [Phycisphaeraceae bacterium]MBX3365879.1 FkbM family methyltransferase [Phycisphaeraceae bacterium]